MDFQGFWTFAVNRSEKAWALLGEHAVLVFIAIAIAIILGIIIGILITYSKPASHAALWICQILMTIPSLAMFGLLLPFFGIGFKTGVTTLILYSLLPIVRNTYTGIKEIDPSILEAAQGMGMKESSILFRIKLPLAAPVIMAGVRTATVMIIGIAAIASYIGAGGLGHFIFQGINRWNMNMVLLGAIAVSILAIIVDFLMKKVEHRMVTK